MEKEAKLLPKEAGALTSFADPKGLLAMDPESRTQHAMQHLAKQSQGRATMDMQLLDQVLLQVEARIHQGLASIMQNPDWKQFEASWMSLDYLVRALPEHANIELDVLSANKAVLKRDAQDAPDLEHSLFHRIIYQEEYDTPGGNPYAAAVMDVFIENTHDDLAWAEHLAEVGEQAHCPFLLNVASDFFKQKKAEDLHAIQPLDQLIKQTDYLRFNALRENHASRYLSLCLPRFSLRLPYGKSNPCQCGYEEDPYTQSNIGLWGKASFALATCMVRSFHEHGWGVHIQGPQSGGLIKNLHTHHYDHGFGLEFLSPMETVLPERLEMQLSDAGFLPLSYYKNSQQACFFSSNSMQKPDLYDEDFATANSRMNTKLPYIMLTSRIAHYLKVLQRENIGSCKDAKSLENELNRWLQQYVTRMNHPDANTVASHPLKSAKVCVNTVDDRPGYYRVALQVCPHWHMEGMDVALSCVSWLPQSS